MYGLDTYMVLLETRNARNLTAYNGWNFTRSEIWDHPSWDNIWYSHDTTLLVKTEPFKIGAEALESILLDLHPI